MSDHPVNRPYNSRRFVWVWLFVGTLDLWVGAYGLGAGKTPWFPLVLAALGVAFLFRAFDLQLRWDEYDNQRKR